MDEGIPVGCPMADVDSSDRRRAQDKWHIDKGIQLTHIGTTLAIAVSIIVYATRLEQRIALAEQAIAMESSSVARRESSNDARLDRIEVKLDRLIELKTEAKNETHR